MLDVVTSDVSETFHELLSCRKENSIHTRTGYKVHEEVSSAIFWGWGREKMSFFFTHENWCKFCGNWKIHFWKIM